MKTSLSSRKLRFGMKGIVALWIALFMVAYASTLAWANQSFKVLQQDRAFNIKTISVAAGDQVQFFNDDEFIHQIYIKSDSFNFDSAESEPGNVIDLKFTVPGMYEVHCHIHPKMLLRVTVQ
jgi:plastocyanin